MFYDAPVVDSRCSMVNWDAYGSDSIEIKTEQVRIEMRINGPA